MKIYVTQISEDEGLDIHHVFPEREPRLRGKDGRILGAPSIDAQATRSGDELRLTGTVAATVELDCARCLAPVRVNVDESFDLFYVPSVNRLQPDEERELAKDDLLVAFYRDDCLDLADVVREQIDLAIPMARVCSDECRGFCPNCGANLNESKCSCSGDEPDPRWAVLEQLRSDNTGSR
jgi:uncharacterized protein